MTLQVESVLRDRSANLYEGNFHFAFGSIVIMFVPVLQICSMHLEYVKQQRRIYFFHFYRQRKFESIFETAKTERHSVESLIIFSGNGLQEKELQ